MKLNSSYSIAAFDLSSILVARWREDQDFGVESPAEIKWGDGSAATVEDFVKHEFDTLALRSHLL